MVDYNFGKISNMFEWVPASNMFEHQICLKYQTYLKYQTCWTLLLNPTFFEKKIDATKGQKERLHSFRSCFTFVQLICFVEHVEHFQLVENVWLDQTCRTFIWYQTLSNITKHKEIKLKHGIEPRSYTQHTSTLPIRPLASAHDTHLNQAAYISHTAHSPLNDTNTLRLQSTKHMMKLLYFIGWRSW